jgi:hypothetical protein
MANKKVTITLKSHAEAVRLFEAAENAMDMFDNGTSTKNGLRRLVELLCDAANESLPQATSAARAAAGR